MWGYPATLWVFVAASVWFLADAVVNQPKMSIIAAAIALAGLPFYYYWRRSAAVERARVVHT